MTDTHLAIQVNALTAQLAAVMSLLHALTERVKTLENAPHPDDAQRAEDMP